MGQGRPAVRPQPRKAALRNAKLPKLAATATRRRKVALQGVIEEEEEEEVEETMRRKKGKRRVVESSSEEEEEEEEKGEEEEEEEEEEEQGEEESRVEEPRESWRVNLSDPQTFGIPKGEPFPGFLKGSHPNSWLALVQGQEPTGWIQMAPRAGEMGEAERDVEDAELRANELSSWWCNPNYKGKRTVFGVLPSAHVLQSED